MTETSARLDDLTEIHARIWGELARAAQDPQHEWRTPVLATSDGSFADARTVVLRELDVTAQRLRFYADDRSSKVTQMLRNPLGTMVMWSPRLSWQLRCRVQLELEEPGPAVSARWSRISRAPAEHDYLAPGPAGAHIAHDLVSRDHFAVLSAQIISLEWLELTAAGHRRALFSHGEGRWLES